jgi:hypothetical protein
MNLLHVHVNGAGISRVLKHIQHQKEPEANLFLGRDTFGRIGLG